MNVSLNSKIPNRIFSKPHGTVHLGPGNMKSAAAVLGQTKNLNLASGPMSWVAIMRTAHHRSRSHPKSGHHGLKLQFYLITSKYLSIFSLSDNIY